MVNAEQSGKSPRNADVLRPIFPQDVRTVAIEHAADLISAAFHGPSENAICDKAAERLGCDPSTIRSILRHETKRVDFALVLGALRHMRDPWSLPGVRRIVMEVLSK